MAIISHDNSAMRMFLTLSTSVAALLSTPALAQQAADEDAASTGDIVVTAQFREQKLQDTPISITAVDAALLESRNQTDLSQIAAQAPNVTLNDTMVMASVRTGG